MSRWITKSIEYWDRINEGKTEHDLSESMKLIAEYDRIVEKAGEEYKYESPSRYYRDGYNTYKRMYEEREKYVLFLLGPSVPPSSDLAERSGRRYKRKNHQVMAFRSEKRESVLL